ncbi:MAG: hypothetical protein AAGJ10_20715 [Bacteroidota bacterium]
MRPADLRPDNDDSAPGLFQTLVLAATLTAAARISRAWRERKAGIDPTEDEPQGVAEAYVQEAIRTLQTEALQLRTTHVLLHRVDEDADARAVRHFDGLTTLQRLVDLLQRTHQRLLSLYPVATPELVEAARGLYTDGLGLVESTATVAQVEVDGFAAAVLSFAAELEEAFS